MTEILLSDLSIEILGAVTGLIYLYFSIRQNILLWPWGIITSLLYVYVFFQAKFYADMSIQVYYLGISIYGWYYWKTGRKNEGTGLVPIVRASGFAYVGFVSAIILLTITVGYGLDTYTDSPLPYWDAFTAGGSVVATWMLARKYLEHWLFWIVIDLVSLGTYLYKELYPTVFLFAVYSGVAVIGFYQWRKEWIKNN